MIANAQAKIQIVDTHESLRTLTNIDFDAHTFQINRTLVSKNRHPTISRSKITSE